MSGLRSLYETTDPAAAVLAGHWQSGTPAPALIAGLLREVGAADLADDNDLITSIAQRLPDVVAGRFEI